MITKQTKLQSFREIGKDLGPRQARVLNELSSQVNPVTAGELAYVMWNKGLVTTPDRNNTHPRLNELVSKGHVEVVGKRACKVSGKTCAVYQKRGGLI